MIIGPWKKKLTVGDSVERPWPGARVSMRVFVERVGGAEPSVRVRARGERQPFQIRVTAEQAREFGALLYRQVDIVATLWRDENGQVTEAVLRELHSLDDSRSPKAWFDWLREHGTGRVRHPVRPRLLTSRHPASFFTVSQLRVVWSLPKVFSSNCMNTGPFSPGT